MNENPSAPSGTLHELVRQGDSAQLEIAIHAGADVNARDESEMTPLMLAIEQDDASSLTVLLRHGADPTLAWPNQQHYSWSRALHQLGGVKLANALLDAVDDPRVLLQSGCPAGEETTYLWMDIFALNRKGAGRLTQRLLDLGFDPNERFLNGFTPLLIAARKADAKTAEVIPVLLEAGADLHAVSEPNLAYQQRRDAELAEMAASGKDISRLRKPIEHEPETVLQVARRSSKKAYKIFQELMQDQPAVMDRFDLAAQSVAKWKQAPNEERFEAFSNTLSVALDCQPKPFRMHASVLQYTVKMKQLPSVEDEEEDDLRRLEPFQASAREAGATLIYQNDADTLNTKVRVLLVPTLDWAAIVCLSKTDGANDGLSTRDLVNRLAEIEETFPFAIQGGGKDFLALRFEPPSDALPLHRSLAELCPDFDDDPDSQPDELQQLYADDGRCYLWWD